MSVTTIAPRALFDIRGRGEQVEIVDVRTPAEYDEAHIDGTALLPLDRLDPTAFLAGRRLPAGTPLYVVCKAGGRAAKACEKFQAAGFANVVSIEGGTDGWIAAGLPVVRGQRKVISLERQVRIAAGSLVLLGVTLGRFVNPGFYGLSAFVGAGLIFAGVTDFCGMGMLLARMPWNQRGGNAACSPTACGTAK